MVLPLKLPQSKSLFLLLHSGILALAIGIVIIAAMLIPPTSSNHNKPDSLALQSKIIPIGVYLSPHEEQVSVSGSPVDQPGSSTSKEYAATNQNSPTSTSRSSTKSLGASTPMIGIYDAASPSDPQSYQRLEEIAAAGFNTVLNYTSWDGSASQIKTYLDKAEQLHLKIIFSLKDFYDIEENQQVPLSQVKAFGNSYEQVALQYVRTFKNHPALYGWYISDERPEVPQDAGKWVPVLLDRYKKIKQIDPAHPTIVILQCYQGTYLADTKSIGNISIATDDLGFDTYPIPYEQISTIGGCANTLSSVVKQPANRWYVIQSFSWASYPDIPRSIGEDVAKARYPTKAELQQMVDQAKQAGVSNFLFYSYFDLKQDTAHFKQNWQTLSQVVKSLRQ